MAARGKVLSPMDADLIERFGEMTIHSTGNEPPASNTSAQDAGEELKSIYEAFVGVLWSPIWDRHVHRLNEINGGLPALQEWLTLRSQPSNTSERQYSFLKLLTLYGLAQSFGTLSYHADSGPSEAPDIPTGEYFLQREQNRISFYNILEHCKRKLSLPSAARSLPAGMFLYMLLQDFGLATGDVDEELLREFMLFPGYTDKDGNMDMNVFCEWAWDFRIRETSNAYIAAELLGNFDIGPAGEFFRILTDARVSGYGYGLHTIESAFRALNMQIPAPEANLLLQDPGSLYQKIRAESAARYVQSFPRFSARRFNVLDKWKPLHRLMIFVACYMTLGQEFSANTRPEWSHI